MAGRKRKTDTPPLLPFWVSKTDFIWEDHRQKGMVAGVTTWCKVTHRQSGAVGVCRIFNTYLQNKEGALRALARSDVFKNWAKDQSEKRTGERLSEVLPELDAA